MHNNYFTKAFAVITIVEIELMKPKSFNQITIGLWLKACQLRVDQFAKKNYKKRI